MPPGLKGLKIEHFKKIIAWAVALLLGFFLRFPVFLQFRQKSDPEAFVARAPKTESMEKAANPQPSIRGFFLTLKTIQGMQGQFGIESKDKPATVLTKLYNALYAMKKGESGSHEIKYDDAAENRIIKSPGEVLTSKEADCDEITRTAYLLAAKSGVKNLIMVEMRWTEEGKEVGHTALVLLGAGEKPLLFDFTHGYNAVPLDSTNVEEGMKKRYTKPDMRIERQLKTLEEVAASHYDQVGTYYN